MKRKLISLSGFLFITLLLCGQPTGYKLFHLYYENSLGEEAVTTFMYDFYGVQYKAFWELLDSSRWSVNMHEYDARGNFIRKYREFSDGITLEQNYTYDEHDRLVFEDFKRSDGRIGEARHFYNKNGKLISSECKNHNGYLNGIILYEYDGQGKRIGAVIEDMGATTGWVEYAYSTGGELVKEFWDFNGRWNQTFRYEYRNHNCLPFRYSSPFLRVPCGFRIESEDYTFNGSIENPSQYVYTDDGKLSTKIYTFREKIKTTTHYNFDETGKLISAYREYSDGITADFSFFYNNAGFMIGKKWRRSDGMSGEESYYYDEHGLLLSVRLLNTDNWISGQIVFTHDHYDRIRSGVFNGEDMSVAELVFVYNTDGCLSSLKWQFADGRKQEYHFNYSRE